MRWRLSPLSSLPGGLHPNRRRDPPTDSEKWGMEEPVQVFVSRAFSCLNTQLSQASLCIQTTEGLQRLKHPALIFP
ncbi:hypothetical protein CapIbe_010770 [Capra ibex]